MRAESGVDGGESGSMTIPLHSLQRRRSRDTNTSLDDEDSYREANRLMQQGRGSYDPQDDVRERQNGDAPRTDYSRWLKPISIIFAVVFLVLILFISFKTLSVTPLTQSKPSNFQPGSSDGTLGIVLHPETHAHRPPHDITQHWNITSDFRSPDGVKKEVYLINGELPGPLIECRSGDRLSIHVTNQLDSDAVSIHWHGLSMRGANAMDGAPGFTQCSILPGASFTYEFDIDADASGTFWYHAHSQVQRGDGMYGGLIVHKPPDKDSDVGKYGNEKEVLLLIGDWYHRSSTDVLNWYMSVRGFGNEPVPDSLLINGAGKFTCSMAVPARPVTCVEKWAEETPGLFSNSIRGIPLRLRIVNVGTLAGFTFGVSSGTLTPLTVDGGCHIIGTSSDSVGILHPGERLDVLLKWDGNMNPLDARLRISLDQENFKYPNPALTSHQSFPFLTSKTVPTGDLMSPWETSAITPFKLDLATASVTPADTYPPVSQTAEQTVLLYTKTEKLSINGNIPWGFMNRTSWAPQDKPSYPLISLPRSSWDDNQLIPFIPIPDSTPIWVDIIVNNLDDGAHPFHLHGYNFYVLASHRSEHGWGSYSPYAKSGDSAIQPNLNLVDPVRKDTVSVPRKGYVVLRFLADNPGIWMFHCHVLFHMASGMAMGILVGGDEGHQIVDITAQGLCFNGGS